MLENINNPQDIKNLSHPEISSLVNEIRQFLLEKVAKTGGHLASNLGVVELTIALHRYLDCPHDSLIWDVGHQCYVHKILTGRKHLFDTLRQKGGLSGFPDPKECEYDLFKTGHASTSISAAMGIAETNRISGKRSKVVAVIGDGSFTGGLALEAINQIGYLQTPMVIVMNDNRMSIAENVGALSVYTKRIEKTKTYQEVKSIVNHLMERCTADDHFCQADIRQLKTALKQVGTPGLLFEKLGLHYLGPIDGHNVSEIEKALKETESVAGPVLLHVITKKGMGYELAENHAEQFHGVSPFDLENGEGQKKSGEESFTDVFGRSILRLAKENKKIIGITAAMPSGTSLNMLANELPDQFYDVGICEQHAVTFASGMARNGFTPVVAVYSSFLQRSLDQVIHDVCLQNLQVIFAIDRAGLVGEDGPTHHGVFDVSFLRFIPNLVLMAPRDGEELELMLEFALELKKPVAIRYPRGSAKDVWGVSFERRPIELGKAEQLQTGEKQVIVSLGNQLPRAMQIAKDLPAATIFNARFIKPIDPEIISAIADAEQAIIIEENAKAGGFGSAIMEQLAAQNIHTPVRLIGIEDAFVEHGKADLLRAEYVK